MAVDVYSENPLTLISPRISFSNDLEEDETTNFPCRLDHSLADSTFDFAFNVDTSISFESSTADILFSDGKILPTSLKKEEDQEEIKVIPVQVQTSELLIPCLDPNPAKKKSLKEFLEDSIDEEEEEPNTPFRSFWKFRRSKSLNCDRNQRKGLIGSSKTLSRSKSTGKFLEKIDEEEDDIEIEKPNRKLPFWKFTRSSSLNSDHANINGHGKSLNGSLNSKPFRRSSSLNCDARIGANQGLIGSDKFLPRSYSTGSATKKQQKFVSITAKSSQKKGYGYGNYNSNVRVSPLLNLPSPYISRVSVDLFGFGSLFCNGNTKDRKRRK